MAKPVVMAGALDTLKVILPQPQLQGDTSLSPVSSLTVCLCQLVLSPDLDFI